MNDTMTETAVASGQDVVAGQVPCPDWCVNGNAAGGLHAHVSADLQGGAPDQPLVARLVGMDSDGEIRVLLNDRVATVEELDNFVGGLRLLLDRARLAEPGLGFVTSLAARADLTVEDLAEASGIPVERLVVQEEGGQVLTVHEYDQLALTVANLVAAARPVA